MTSARRCVLALATVLAGCVPSGRAPFVGGERFVPSAATTCPLGFRGARIGVEDRNAGFDLVLVAYGDVEELQRRARDAAAMHGPGAHRGLGHEGQHGLGGRHGLGLGRLGVRVRAESEDTVEGARIHVAALDPADITRLRQAIHSRANQARLGDCR